MTKIRVSVPAGRRVPLPPPDGRVLTTDGEPEGGWEVEETTFIYRRLADGDLVVAAPSRPAAPAKPAAAAQPAPPANGAPA